MHSQNCLNLKSMVETPGGRGQQMIYRSLLVLAYRLTSGFVVDMSRVRWAILNKPKTAGPVRAGMDRNTSDCAGCQRRFVKTNQWKHVVLSPNVEFQYLICLVVPLKHWKVILFLFISRVDHKHMWHHQVIFLSIKCRPPLLLGKLPVSGTYGPYGQ